MKTRYTDRVAEETIHESGQVNCVNDMNYNAGHVASDNIVRPSSPTETSQLTIFLAKLLEEQKAQTLLLTEGLGALRQQLGELKSDDCSRPASSGNKIRSCDSLESKGNRLVETTNHIISPKGFVPELPRVELSHFSGNPTDYWKFIRQFETYVEGRILDDSQRLLYLQHYCKGESLKAIEQCVMLPSQEGYVRARRILEDLYGQPHVIAKGLLDELLTEAKGLEKSEDGLSMLALKMEGCQIALEQMHYLHDLNSMVTLERIVRSLPAQLQLNWAVEADKIGLQGREPTFAELLTFVSGQARIRRSRFGQLAKAASRITPETVSQGATVQRARAFALNTTSVMKSCMLCHETHRLGDCATFVKLSVPERWSTCRRLGACFVCLGGSHRGAQCDSGLKCEATNCKRKHHTLLHQETSIETKRVFNTACMSAKVFVGTVPVWVDTPQGPTRTLALIDNGSDTSLVREDFIVQHGLQGYPTRLTIDTVGGKTSLNTTVNCLKLCTSSGPIEVGEAYAVKDLPVHRPCDLSRLAAQWDHLKGIKFDYVEDSKVSLLLGCDVPQAHQVLEQRLGGNGQPFATKTVFGWMLCGPIGKQKGVHQVNCIGHSGVDLHEKVKALYDREFADTSSLTAERSREDEMALRQVTSGTVIVNGHYEIALPWRIDPCRLPDNYAAAYKRWQSLVKRFKADSNLFERYKEVIHQQIERGYSQLVPQGDCSETHLKWYLPHHPVINSKKLRVVLDCAARYSGVSLNDGLFSGPDMTTKLLAVLLRFRLNPVALSADIKEMFMQVRLPALEQGAFRFLWTDNLSDERPLEYQMKSHPFGARSSPFCANFALRKTANDFGCGYDSSTVMAVENNFYVDDCLISFRTVKEAAQFVTQITELLGHGGFTLAKWRSNTPTVLDGMTGPKVLNSTKSTIDGVAEGRALGVVWDSTLDKLCWSFTLPQGTRTRRGLLSCISSLYDPLGVASPWLLPGKMLLQSLCKLSLGWDDVIPETYLQSWDKWFASLQSVGSFRIDRCMCPPWEYDAHNVSLHVFSDASESGYGVAAYAVFRNGQSSHSTIVFGKARVAPIKNVSIPRLELTAATLAVRVSQQINDMLPSYFAETYLWTDSMIVLHYIYNKSTRFSTFVANRLTVIHDLSKESQWRHVDSKSNPADKASRGALGNNGQDLWIYGPQFIRDEPSCWPAFKLEIPDTIDIERKSPRAVVCLTTTEAATQFLNYYSGWIRLLRGVAWMRRFFSYLKIVRSGDSSVTLRLGSLRVDELQAAERAVIAVVQRTHFAKELRALRSGEHPLARDSCLRRLSPILVNGMIRVGGRLNAWNYPFELKHPVILPKRHHVVRLLINHYHELEAHAGWQHVLNTIRTKFWIVQGGAAVKAVVGGCYKCRRVNAPMGEQLMAPLPEVRIVPGWHPFDHVGMDYFGPLLVKRGRVIDKRFGCVITCLKSRAVHLEVAHSMTTDSLMLLLNRFVGRRGPPSSIYSDNGSNFCAADKELKRLIEGLDHKFIGDQLLARKIEWHFNVPLASHRGGVWERLIRSIRQILSVICHEQHPDDETLLTVMVEAERVLNNRPLVPVCTDESAYPALTPNDLILLRQNEGLVEEPDIVLRYSRRWRQAKQLAMTFWKRWVSEYVPLLQKRQKWVNRTRNFRVGDVVLLVNEIGRGGRWPLGLVTDAIVSEDGLVRSVQVRTERGNFLRDIRSLSLLEGYDSVTVEQRLGGATSQVGGGSSGPSLGGTTETVARRSKNQLVRVG